jgi:hypothetical protein
MVEQPIDISKWWGPYQLHAAVKGTPVPVALRCVFCKLPPLVGDDVVGISDLIFHADYQLCHGLSSGLTEFRDFKRESGLWQ